MLDFVAQRGSHTISSNTGANCIIQEPVRIRDSTHVPNGRFVGVFLHIYSVDPILVAREI